MQINLFDAASIGQLVWPDTEEGRQAKSLLLPMIAEGVPLYIRNVETQLLVLKVNEHIIPLTVNDKEYNNSYLTSNYFPIKYLVEQLNKKKTLLSHLQKPLVKSVGGLLKMIKINKAVVVNNWLLTTNIYPALTEQEWEEVTNFLKKSFPDHTLIFRSLNDYRCRELAKHLQNQKYRLIYSRHVCIYDPKEKASLPTKVRYHHRRDRRLLESEGYEIIRYDQIKPEESRHLLELYSKIYISRHTRYSPQYTERYLQAALKNQFLHLVGIKKEQTLYGIIGFHQAKETLIAPFLGYNEEFGEPNHLYRMLTMAAIDESEARGVSLDDGSGGEETKLRRGMKAFPEYVALYDGHLPLYRRLFWKIAEQVMRRHAIVKSVNF